VIDGVGVNGAGWLTRFTLKRFDLVGYLDCGRLRAAWCAHRLGFQLSRAADSGWIGAELHAADRARLDWIFRVLLLRCASCDTLRQKREGMDAFLR
jgi:hypothetical protein